MLRNDENFYLKKKKIDLFNHIARQTYWNCKTMLCNVFTKEKKRKKKTTGKTRIGQVRIIMQNFFTHHCFWCSEPWSSANQEHAVKEKQSIVLQRTGHLQETHLMVGYGYYISVRPVWSSQTYVWVHEATDPSMLALQQHTKNLFIEILFWGL